MDINSIVDKLNNQLDKLNNIKNGNSINTNDFFTTNQNFNDELSLDDLTESSQDADISSDNSDNIAPIDENTNAFSNIEPDDETLSLVTLKERRLLTAQTMFKKSIKVSLKSFLISISISFLNLFI